MESAYNIVIYTIIFLYGIVIGSFLNVCIYRLPLKEDIVKTGSHCMHCGTPLKWYDLIPLFSYLALHGKCRYCKEQISKQYPMIEAANGILYCLIFAVKGITINAVIYCLFASALLALSVIDWRTYEIPEGINLFIAVLGLIHGILDYINWKEYGLGIFSVSLVLLIIYWITKGRGIGGGDIKLMAASGLLLGWKLNLLGFFLGCLLGSVIHLTRMKLCKTGHILALGPYLSAGLMIALMAGEPIIQWYVGLFI